MPKRPSLVQQVTRAFAGITRIGESRHSAKANGTAQQYIFSYASAKSHRQRVITGLRRINAALPPEQRLKLLRDLRPDHVALLKNLMIADGLTGTTIRNELSSWRKLGFALNAAGWNPITPAQLVPKTLYTNLGQGTPRGGYSADHAQQIIAYIVRTHPKGQTLGLMAQLIQATGLRHEEVARLREADLDRSNIEVAVQKSSAKGGRPRTISIPHDGPCRTAMKTALDAIPTGRNWLWLNGPSLARQLQDAIHDACTNLGIEPKGLHGLRATFAETYIRERIDHGLDEKTARDEVTLMLGHNRRAVTYTYAGRMT